MSRNEVAKALDALLGDEVGLTAQDALYALTHRADPCEYRAKTRTLAFGRDGASDYAIEGVSRDAFARIDDAVFANSSLPDEAAVEEYLRHHFSDHLSYASKAHLGTYYTPPELVALVRELIADRIGGSCRVMDLCCGCGAFLEGFRDFDPVGRDVDEAAVSLLRMLGYEDVAVDNSLLGVSRAKYGLGDDAEMVIVGNPPYNETSSVNRRYATGGKARIVVEMDPDVVSSDLGHSFLLAYAKLEPAFICVLHPLSYLVKPTNFRKLGTFPERYRLMKGVVFPSTMFADLKNRTAFPVVAALYGKGSMVFEDVRRFGFQRIGDRSEFSLANLTTIDDLPEARCEYADGKTCKNRFKYVRKVDAGHILRSDIDLYQYNIRDTNSLIAGGNLMYGLSDENTSYCTVMFDELPVFAYLHNYRNFVENDYVLGTVSPLVDVADIHDEEFRDLMVIGAMLTDGHRIRCFDVDDAACLLWTRGLAADYKAKAARSAGGTGRFGDFYQQFVAYVEDSDSDRRAVRKEAILSTIAAYFHNLKRRAF